MSKRTALILCTGNSCRSQIAEALLRRIAPEWEVQSAGTLPAGYVHPFAIAAMAEIGIDISHQRSKSLADFVADEFDYVITVCDSAARNCPIFPNAAVHLHWPTPDPASFTGDDVAGLAAARKVRKQLQDRLEALVRDDPAADFE